jgi:hypothetical protein
MRLAFVMMAGALLLAGASAAARAADGGVDRGCIEARVIGEQRIDGEHEYKPGAIALSPDDRLVASGDKGGNVILWDLASGKRRKSWRAPSGAVWSLAFSADGKSLIAGMATIRCASLRSAAPRARSCWRTRGSRWRPRGPAPS